MTEPSKQPATTTAAAAAPSHQMESRNRGRAESGANQQSGMAKSARGPRRIAIQRSTAGFGFTLRHFIVYPPDPADCTEEWQRGLSAGLDPMVPMDTIFVKHVKENGPAAKAGLCTGDQVVSVNGESVVCKTYVQVVQMIQKSGPTLELVVMPKEHDVLQQCFGDTAHNPYTNARPTSTAVPAVLGGGYQAPPVASSSAVAQVTAQTAAPLPASAALVAAVAAAASGAESGGKGVVQDPSKAANIMSHLPRPKPYQPFQNEPKKPVAGQHATLPVAPVQQPPHAAQQTVVVVPRPSSSAVPLARVVSPLAPDAAPSHAVNRSSNAPVIDEAAAKARLAAAVALVSKSVRKSADFNPSPMLTSAGSRGSLAEYAPPLNAASKRSSFAGTPSSRSEFILSMNPPTFTSPNGSAVSFHLAGHHRDSISSSKGSVYSAPDEQQHAQVMTRIKKSFEQKEEFLKRPALPYWVNVQEAQHSPPVPKEFYAQPQKFSRPVWPPGSASASFDSDSSIGNTATSATHKVTVKTEVHHHVSSAEPWSVVFSTSKATPPASPSVSPGLGLVPNTIPKPFYGSASSSASPVSNATTSPTGTKVFVSTLTRIQENVASGPFEPAKATRTLTLQAPLASPEEFFTPSPTKAMQHPLASVAPAQKAKPFENGAERGLLARIAQRGKVQQQQQQQEQQQQQTGKPPVTSTEARPKFEYHYGPAGGTGNRTVIIGSSRLHCEPPPSSDTPKESSNNAGCAVDGKKPLGRTKTEPLQTDIDSVLGNDRPRRSSSAGSLEQALLDHYEKLWNSLGSPSGSGSLGSASSLTSSVANEPAKLDNNNETVKPGTNPVTANVNRRQKNHDDDADRGMRRASYLKATAGNPVDGSSGTSGAHENETTATPAPPLAAEHAPKGRATNQPHSINKLLSRFGEKVGSVKTHSPSEFAAVVVAAATAPATGHSDSQIGELQRREGLLYVKQTIADGKRSTDRSWRQLWTRLRNGSVHFSRDRNLNANGNGGSSGTQAHWSSNDDVIIDLRGCTVEVAVYYTKRKHVLRLWSANGLIEYLLQCEDNNDMVLWLDSFQQERAAANDKDEHSLLGLSGSEMMLVHQAHEADQSRRQNRFMPNRNRSPTGHSPVSKTRKPSLPNNPGNLASSGTSEPPATPATGKTTTWRHKVAKQFKKFQGSLPNSSGQYHLPNVADGATIGVPLEYCPRSSISESIPLLVELCVGIVEARGLESVGVYRVPGNSLAVNALTESLNRGFDCINQTDPRWNDVNVISSLMKSFFRKLPDPLVTSELYGPLIDANKVEPEQARLNAIKRLIDELPESHYYTLRFLVSHLARVAAKSSVNKMDAKNLAIVFGPTLIRPGDDSTVAMVNDMAHQCKIVETLIDKIDFFFPSDDQLDNSIPPNSPTQTSTSNLSVEKDAYAKEIVLNIITAAKKKRQSSLDSPDLSERNDGSPQGTPTPKAGAVGGSVHSLVELGSTGCQPALPVDEACEYRAEIAPVAPERKRSASLGGETVLPPPPSLTGSHDLAGISELDAAAGPVSSDLRPRTSSGSFVVIKVPPIDAAGIRSYSGLSAVTQERIRLFEQETKALLQRDLARQRRDGEASASTRRLDKTDGETAAWLRAKLEMETDDYLDALADNPTESKMQPAKTESQAEAKAAEPTDEPNESKRDSTPSSSSSEEETVPVEKTATSEEDEKEKAEEPSTAKPLSAASKQPVKTASRSQTAKVSRSSESSPSKTGSPTPTKASLARAAKTRSAQPVVSRAKTVDLGKGNAPVTTVAARKASSVDQQPAKIVRQSSLGTVQSQPSPTRAAPGRLSLRLKGSESPVKRLSASSVKSNVDESKKAATSSDGEQTKRLLESNIDEQLNGVPEQSKSETLSKEAEASPSDRLSRVSIGVKRAVESKVLELGKGVKRSDSLTKDEKTENNVKARERDMRTTGNAGQRLRRFVQRESGLKRRHTVGGTRDFDKVRIRWLADNSTEGRSIIPAPRWSAWDRLQPLISDEDLNVDRSLKTWMRSERMRTSSPELCRRLESNSNSVNLPATLVEVALAGEQLPETTAVQNDAAQA